MSTNLLFSGGPTGIKNRLRDAAIRPEKSKGQNFLCDDAVADQIADFANLEQGERVLEIGCGLGILTARLQRIGVDLHVVELEEPFCQLMERHAGLERGTTIFQGDIRRFDPAQLVKDGAKIKVVSNLPYSISTDVVEWILENRASISSASLLLQREFAERLAADPGSRTYGSITVYRSLFADAELGFTVPGDSFFPTTEVESAMLRLTLLPAPRVPLSDEKLFFDVVRASFSSRRKTLLNCLFASNLVPVATKAEMSDILNGEGIDPIRRAETLGVADFARIAERFRTLRSSSAA